VPARLRRFLRSAAADVLHYSAAAESWRLFRRTVLHRNEVCVLGLHRVLTKSEKSRSNSLDAMVLNETTFVALLAHLKNRFHVIPLESLFKNKAEQAAGSKPWCLLTFDDGWQDTYTRAYPALKKFALPAAVFLATGSMESRGGFWVEQVKKAWNATASRAHMMSALNRLGSEGTRRLTEIENIVEWLKRMPADKRDAFLNELLPSVNSSESETDPVDAMLTWQQAVEMGRHGIEIGAHTVTHPLLSYENDATVERELCQSKQTLEEKLGKPVRAFAYPNGDWDGRVRRWVKQAGYECAFTTRPGWYDQRQDPYTIRRILLHEGNVTDRNGQFSPAMLSLTLAGRA
jgi:peptidoglycan/xylan/chitin deacetylase (PgdA/CDA1 family)